MDILDLPDSLLLHILTFLHPKDILRTGKTCTKWRRITQDEMLWKNKFHSYFNVAINLPVRPEMDSWRSEFLRLVDCVPTVQTQVIDHHTDEIWFVSFSHNGNYFATCSKDGSFAVWNSTTHPIHMQFYKDMKVYDWQWVWYPEFNSTDTFLLVSGVGYSHGTGETAIFDLQSGGDLMCRVPNNNYSVSGTWLTENSFLSGTSTELRNLHDHKCEIILNQPREGTSILGSSPTTSVISKKICQLRTTGGGALGRVLTAKFRVSKDQLEEARKLANMNLKFQNVAGSNSNDIRFSNEYLQNCDELNSDEDLELNSWLIFGLGSRTYMEHQVGFKKLNFQVEKEGEKKAGKFDEIDLVMDFHGFVVGLALSPDHKYLYVNCRPWPSDYFIVDPFSPPDISQDTDIHVIHLPTLTRVGMTQRVHTVFLSDPSAHIYIYVRASELYFGSGSSGYGGPVRDLNGYLWDRYYGITLVKLPHEGHVSCMAFKEKLDPQILVSVSHDKRIRIWRSTSQCRKMGIRREELTKAVKQFPGSVC